MVSQAFLYNAIFFTYALVLTKFYGVAERPDRALPAAVRGGQLPRARSCSGRLFDTVGRKPMIAGDLLDLGRPAGR